MSGARLTARLVVIGGGITGLTAAYRLAHAREQGASVEETLIEASPRLGGVIQTERIDGFVVEAGPDSFLAEKPQAAALARELGLGDELIGSNDHARRTYILHRGRLAPLPDGLMFMVPTRLWPLLTTPLLPFSATLAVAREMLAGRPRGEREDESAASFLERHFGRAMVENIADPLLAGVYGGDSHALSARSVLPRFWELEQRFGSLTRATLATKRARRRAAKRSTASGEWAAGPGAEFGYIPSAAAPENRDIQNAPASAAAHRPPLFMTLRGGLGQMAQKLAQRVRRIVAGRPVLALEPCSGGTILIRIEGGESYEAEGVVVCLPAHVAAGLTLALDHHLAALLDGIPYSSSVTVTLGFGSGVQHALPPGFGFLVPRKEGKRMLACTFVHGKFDYRVPEGQAMLRCFLGGWHDPEALKAGDREAVSSVRRELRDILGLTAEPLFYRVHRWPASMAQYVVGHAERVRAIEQRLEALPGVYLAGNAYSGIGISDCIRTATAAAERALDYVARARFRAEGSSGLDRDPPKRFCPA